MASREGANQANWQHRCHRCGSHRFVRSNQLKQCCVCVKAAPIRVILNRCMHRWSGDWSLWLPGNLANRSIVLIWPGLLPDGIRTPGPQTLRLPEPLQWAPAKTSKKEGDKWSKVLGAEANRHGLLHVCLPLRGQPVCLHLHDALWGGILLPGHTCGLAAQHAAQAHPQDPVVRALHRGQCY